MIQGMQLQARQHLTMTPLLQRAINFLQMSSLEYEQQVEEALSSNPLLERVDAPDSESGEDSDSIESAPFERTESFWDIRSTGSSPDDEFNPILLVPRQTSLREHLRAQAGCLPLLDRDCALVHALIDAIDPSGYLTITLDELTSLFEPVQAPDESEWLAALRQVQSFDPPGVGARNVAECLALQLNERAVDVPGRALALEIINRHLQCLASRDFQKLQRTLACDDEALARATLLIRRLVPRPGAAFYTEPTQFVVADILVTKAKGRWRATVNPRVIPKIQVNQVYAALLKVTNAGTTSDAGGFATQLQEARWMVRNIEQRFDTILSVAQEIVKQQAMFFEYGEIGMKPLKLRDISDVLGIHESTVSRVASSKYMSTPRGLLEFKHFFGSQVETAEGAPCSAAAVRALIRQVIANEKPERPLSDIKVTRALAEQGIKVARRTVSKYRDLLQIPSVDIRRMSGRKPTALSALAPE